MPLSVLPAWQTISHKFTLNYNQQCVATNAPQRGGGQQVGELLSGVLTWFCRLVFCHLFGEHENVFQTRIGPFCKRATEWGSTLLRPPAPRQIEQTHNRTMTSAHPLRGSGALSPDRWNFPADFAFIFRPPNFVSLQHLKSRTERRTNFPPRFLFFCENK